MITFLHDLASDERNNAEDKASGFSRMLSKFDMYFVPRLPPLVVSRLGRASAAFHKITLGLDQAEKMIKVAGESLAG